MTPGGSTQRGPLAGALSWCGRNGHFLAAASLLVLTLAVTRALGWAEKLPVPWPAGVLVAEDFRLESLPTEIGPFARAADGELDRESGGRPRLDGQADGELIYKKDELRTLSIGTSYDERRYAEQSSNWYLARIYRDLRVRDLRNPYALWRLEVYYYSGVPDKVPHVPERCLVAGGVTVTGSGGLSVQAPLAPENHSAWRSFPLQRVRYRRSASQGGREGVEYYVFSLNGSPENRWEEVRLGMLNPLVRHCYFAKIQFSPIGDGAVTNLDEADAAAADFINMFLPAVLKALPSKADVEDLDRRSKAGK